MSLGGSLFEFAVVCLATAFACTAIKEAEDERLARGGARLLGVLAGGIAAFGLGVQLLTWAAG